MRLASAAYAIPWQAPRAGIFDPSRAEAAHRHGGPTLLPDFVEFGGTPGRLRISENGRVVLDPLDISDDDLFLIQADQAGSAFILAGVIGWARTSAWAAQEQRIVVTRNYRDFASRSLS